MGGGSTAPTLAPATLASCCMPKLHLRVGPAKNRLYGKGEHVQMTRWAEAAVRTDEDNTVQSFQRRQDDGHAGNNSLSL